MIEIIEALDEWAAEQYSGLTTKLWGYSELIHRTSGTPPTDQPIPVKIVDGVADRGTNQISLDDKFELITWVRLTGLTTVENEEDNWGIKDGRRQSAALRWIIAHKVELGESFINDLIRDMPDRFIIDGFDFAHINPDIEVDVDHEAVYRTELGNTAYEKHRFNWNLYAISVNVEFIKCVPSD